MPERRQPSVSTVKEITAGMPAAFAARAMPTPSST